MSGHRRQRARNGFRIDDDVCAGAKVGDALANGFVASLDVQARDDGVLHRSER
jgi:hypothetical protein